MGDNDDILTALQLHDDGFEPDDHITIALPATVAIVIFVVVAGFEILGVAVGDFLVSQAVADARVELVEGFPFEFIVSFGRGG